MPQKDHTVLIVVAMCLVGMTSLICATLLITKGYTAELMVGIVSGVASSLGTMLGQRRAMPTAGASNVEGNQINNLPAEPAKPQPPQPPVATP